MRTSETDGQEVARHVAAALVRLEEGEPLVVSLRDIDDATSRWLKAWLIELVSPARLAYGRDHLVTFVEVSRELRANMEELLRVHSLFIRVGAPDGYAELVGHVTAAVRETYSFADLGGPQHSPELAKHTGRSVQAVGDVLRRILVAGAISRHPVRPSRGNAQEYRTRVALPARWKEDLAARVDREDGGAVVDAVDPSVT